MAKYLSNVKDGGSWGEGIRAISPGRQKDRCKKARYNAGRWEKLLRNSRLVKHNTRTDQGMWVENPSIYRTCDKTASTKRVPVREGKGKGSPDSVRDAR